MSRTIRTAAELDALPVGSVVLDRWGRAWQKHDPEGHDPLWHAAKHHTRRYNTAALIERGPMLVLHDPAAPAPAPSVAPVEESADWTYPTATDMTLGDFQSAGLIVPGILVEFYDQRGSGTALIGHLNDLLGICDDCPENRNAQVVRYRRGWSPEDPNPKEDR